MQPHTKSISNLQKPDASTSACKTSVGSPYCDVSSWVGLEDEQGAYPDNNLAQAGTDAQVTCTTTCTTTYYAFYQFAANSNEQDCSTNVASGDTITAVVENDALAGNPGYYDMTVTDSRSGSLCSITNHAYSMTAYGEPFIMERVQDSGLCTANSGNYCTLGIPTTSGSKLDQFTTGDIIYSNGTQTSTSIPYNAGYYYDDTMQNTATVGTQNGNTYTNTSNGAVGSSGQFSVTYLTSGGT